MNKKEALHLLSFIHGWILGTDKKFGVKIWDQINEIKRLIEDNIKEEI